MNGSSMINDAAKEGDHLLVEFKGGKMYCFVGAGHLENELRSAPSAGRFFHARIRGRFTSYEV